MSKSIPNVSIAVDPRELYEFVTLLRTLLDEAEQVEGTDEAHQHRAATLRRLLMRLEPPLLRTLVRGAKASREAGHDATR